MNLNPRCEEEVYATDMCGPAGDIRPQSEPALSQLG